MHMPGSPSLFAVHRTGLAAAQTANIQGVRNSSLSRKSVLRIFLLLDIALFNVSHHVAAAQEIGTQL